MIACRPLGRLNEAILQRICGEYLEMPGLQLTLKQAQRLWGLDEETCARSLAFLVENGFLALDTYASAPAGEHPRGIDHFCIGIDVYQPDSFIVEAGAPLQESVTG